MPSLGVMFTATVALRNWRQSVALAEGMRYLARVLVEVNRLSNQVLVMTYEEEWGRVAP